MKNIFLGIDIGGTNIKSALVDVNSLTLVSRKVLTQTPKNSTPHNILEQLKYHVIEHMYSNKTIGVGFPGQLKNGYVKYLGNLDKSWMDFHLPTIFTQAFGIPVEVINDADAAGLSELKLRENSDKVKLDEFIIFLTLGTGLGSVFINNGNIISSIELGLMKVQDTLTAEDYIKKDTFINAGLDYKQWGLRLNDILIRFNQIFMPDYFILGGGVTEFSSIWLPQIELENVKIAEFKNDAGIIGSAINAAQRNNI